MMASNSTGWDNGLCQDYNGDLGRWFANRLGAKHQLRKDFEMSKAQELAAQLDKEQIDTVRREVMNHEAAAMLRTLEAERDKLASENARLHEACSTFCEWLDREEKGFAYLGHDRETVEGEAAWKEWFYGNIALCDEAQKLARVALKGTT